MADSVSPSASHKRPDLPLLTSFTVDGKILASTFNLFSFPAAAELVPMEHNLLPDKFCCGSSHGWLALIDLTPRLTLFNPLTNSQIDLPPYSPFLPQQQQQQQQPVTNIKLLRRYYTRTKIVLSADPSVDPHFLVIQMGGVIGTGLVFWRRGDDSWTKVEHPGSRLLTNALFYEGNIVFTSEDDVFAYNIEQNHLFRRIPLTGIVTNRGHLVESAGDLLFVALSCILGDGLEMLYSFDVFKVVLGEHKLVEVESLGDRALFLGSNLGISLDASDYPGCKANCVYLAEYNQQQPVMVRVCRKDGNEFINGQLSQVCSQRALVSSLWLKPSLLPGPAPLA